MTHETLDEQIDRVASTLTAVEADAWNTSRISPRVREGRRRPVGVLLTAASVALVLLAVVFSRNTADAPRGEVSPPRVELPSQARAPLAPLPEGARPVNARQRARTTVATAADVVSATLELDVPPLAVPEIVVAPLEIDRLTISDIDDDEKEPR